MFLCFLGAAASIEVTKPLDASDIRATTVGSLELARGEVVRLRAELGHLAKLAGIEIIVYDASDIVLGQKEEEDFERCVQELSHIRTLLRLHTQSDKRRARSYQTLKTVQDLAESKGEEPPEQDRYLDRKDDSGSDSDSSRD